MADNELTFANDDRLPRVPLPELRDSCARFLDWCAPLLTAEELVTTEATVAAFLNRDSPAHTLQSALERYDAEEGVHSWLDTFWPYRYLGRRDRIALNANFFFLFEDSPLGQVDRAAELVAAGVAYKLLIDEQHLPPVAQRGLPVSMEQNKYLFSATRIPGRAQDSARTPYSADWPGPSQARHVVVLLHGNMFRLDVIAPDGSPYTTDELVAGLRAVMTAGATPAPPGTSVGHLTTMARAEWAASRQALLGGHPGNAAMLDAVETALFCLCLEDTAVQNPLQACDQLLHGQGGNRWYDKSFSLIVFPDGTAGLNGEHCKLDGTTIVSLIDAILDSPSHSRAVSGAPAYGRIEFVLDAALQADIDAAAASFAAYTADAATTTLSIENFTSAHAKQLAMSPDAFAQMAFQLAHQRARGRLGATYESIATRGFRHGRTEAMRVVTPEVVRFVAVMDDPTADEQIRRTALRAAADIHVQRAKQCQAGQTPEQHLWELQLQQQRRGTELCATEPLALYESPGWLIMRRDYLSTSAVPSPHVRYWGFGSTGATCIGIGYALLPDRFDLFLSAPRAISEQLSAFAEALPSAVRELHDLLAAEPEALR